EGDGNDAHAQTDEDEEENRKIFLQHSATRARPGGQVARPYVFRTEVFRSCRGNRDPHEPPPWTGRVGCLSCLVMVPMGRLELPRLSPPPPQDGVSTNFTTSAFAT